MIDTDVTTPDSFRFFRTFYEATKMIGGDKARLQFYDAISEYVFINKLPPFLDDESAEGRMLNMAWLLVKPIVDKSIGNSNGGRNSGGDRPSMRNNKNAQKQHDYNSQSTVEQQSINRDKDKGIGMDKEVDKKKDKDADVGNELAELSPQDIFEYLVEIGYDPKVEQMAKCYNYVRKKAQPNWKGVACEWLARQTRNKKAKKKSYNFYG